MSVDMIRSWGCCVVLLAVAASAWGQRAVRISVGPGDQQANGQSWYNSISQDGRFIGFHSQATNLVGGENTGVDEAFVTAGLKKLLRGYSVDSVGNEGNDSSDRAVVSGDGCFVAFQSEASNLVGDDTNGRQDVSCTNWPPAKLRGSASARPASRAAATANGQP